MLTLTQNVNFTLLFAILHEIPITPQDLLSSWEMLLHNDFLGQNWYFKARTDAVFFEKSCLKIQFLSENQLLSGNVLFLRYTHITIFFWLRRTRLNWIITSPCPEATLDTFGFPVGSHPAAQQAILWPRLPKMTLFETEKCIFCPKSIFWRHPPIFLSPSWQDTKITTFLCQPRCWTGYLVGARAHFWPENYLKIWFFNATPI